MSGRNFRKRPDPEGLSDLDAVEEVVDYQGGFADKSAILSEVGRVQAVRVYWLEELRGEWQWVDDHYNEKYGTGYVLFERKVEDES